MSPRSQSQFRPRSQFWLPAALSAAIARPALTPFWAVSLAVLMLCTFAASTNASATATEIPGTPTQAQSLPITDDVLALGEDFKAVLDARIAPINNPERRAYALHELLFAPGNYAITYAGQHTFTAMGTLNHGGGNCMSLANLFVAAARHVGLNAFFQEAQLADWQDREDNGYYVLAGHVNVLVKLNGRKRMTVEFLEAFVGRPANTRVLSDDEALAQYYNNLAMDQLHDGQPNVAQAYLQKALATDDSNPLLWSNMGVVAKRLGHLDRAEALYLQALKRERNHPSAAKNLSLLYREIGHPGKAEKYAKVVEKHNRRNPYYLGKLAGDAMQREQYSDAIKLLRRAIKIKQDEDRFHFELAQAYYFTGDLKRATRAMAKAKALAETSSDRQRYSGKLMLLNRLYEQS